LKYRALGNSQEPQELKTIELKIVKRQRKRRFSNNMEYERKETLQHQTVETRPIQRAVNLHERICFERERRRNQNNQVIIQTRLQKADSHREG
jgi:hypothetical protein